MDDVKPGFAREWLQDFAEMGRVEAEEEARTWGNPAALTRVLLAGGDYPSDVRALEAKLRELQADSCVEIMRRAAAKSYPSSERGDKGAPLTRCARWGSGIEALDVVTGGFYGNTILGGEAGVAKSILALGSSLLAAKAGFRVIYANCELMDGEIMRRVGGFLQAADDPCLSRWEFHNFYEECTFQGFANDVSEYVHFDDERVLVVVDSLNSFIRKQGGRDYFHHVDELVGWTETCVRKSAGKLCFLLISELNKGGGIKGETGEYVCALSVRMKHADKNPDAIDISTEKGREGGGYRSYGRYRINHKRCILEPIFGTIPAEEVAPVSDARDPGAWDEI